MYTIDNFMDGTTKTDIILEDEIIELMLDLGFSPHILGFNYVAEGIRMTVDDTSVILKATKDLYPAIGAKYGSSPTRVERCIRHAIERAWNVGNLETINDIFGYSVDFNKGRPTNSEFIALAALRIKQFMRNRSA